MASEAEATLTQAGDFEVTTSWPSASGPWGGHPDLHYLLSKYHSSYYRPIGENTAGHPYRWTDPKIDKIIEEMEKFDWDDPINLELGMEALKVLVEEMPTIPTFGYPGFVGWDEYYWTNYPGAENTYIIPYHHWPNFKYMLPFLEPVER